MIGNMLGRLRNLTGRKDTSGSPVILIGKGGGGTRLLSRMALDCGVAMGTDLNASLDSVGLVEAVYRSVHRKFDPASPFEPGTVQEDLRAAARVLADSIPGKERRNWGFKLPECIFLLPELLAAFPEARLAVILRDPMATALRRTHTTSRATSDIGSTTLPAAYRHCGLDPVNIEADPQFVHNAVAVVHQLDMLMDHLDNWKKRADSVFITRFEDIVKDPAGETDGFAEWLGGPVVSRGLVDAVNLERATHTMECPSDVLQRVRDILTPTYERIHGLNEWKDLSLTFRSK